MDQHQKKALYPSILASNGQISRYGSRIILTRDLRHCSPAEITGIEWSKRLKINIKCVMTAKLLQDGTLKTRKSLVTDAQADGVRAKLTPSENMEVDDKMLNQFLRATKQDVEKVKTSASLLMEPSRKINEKLISKVIGLENAYL